MFTRDVVMVFCWQHCAPFHFWSVNNKHNTRDQFVWNKVTEEEVEENESAKEVMDSGPFEFIEVTKHCSNYDMLEEERMKVKVEDCSDNEKLEDGRMKVKVEGCSDYDMLEDGRMKVKVEDCTDEDVIVKVEHDIDEDDESKRLVQNRHLSFFSRN
ncbi:hypothetical protein Pcinc_003566 [Petrolisthes cinctipes]|uniref:Uncharacterized protein n=1 Tax=Petrolisthes cinctipes TaxID=88211 RepID=A0AAE1GH31_PETCI|nr:hypothetical protein Pcinc_003566 [Petrolisthes cinctipes]